MSTQIALVEQGSDPISLVESAAKLRPATKAQYVKALRHYLDTGAAIGDPVALATYAATLPTSSRAFLKAAVNLWADKMALAVRSQATPENLPAVDATLHRLAALKSAIEVQAAKGTKAHIWLSPTQVKMLFNATDGGIEGERDRVALGLLVAAGLRREEAVGLTFDDLKYQPVGDRMRTVLAVRGKGAKDRAVPISDQLAAHIDTWGRRVGHTGRIVRSLGRNREPGESMSAVALFKLVARHGAKIGKPGLAAHDLRRTYAQLGYQAGVSITQISTLLGHADVGTTQRYLDLQLDLAATASDFVPWG